MPIHIAVEPQKAYQGGPDTLKGFTVRASNSEGLTALFVIPLAEAPAIVKILLEGIRDYQVATAQKLRDAAAITDEMREAAATLPPTTEEAS